MPERTSKVAKTFNDTPKKRPKIQIPQDMEQITFQLDILEFFLGHFEMNWLHEIKDEMIIVLKSVKQRSANYIYITH